MLFNLMNLAHGIIQQVLGGDQNTKKLNDERVNYDLRG